jgi:hypothetical protein
MNLKVLQWLLAHRDLLTKVLEVVKGWRKDQPVIDQWAIVDQVARLVLPVLSEADLRAMQAIDWDEDTEVGAFALGGEYASMGLDWNFILTNLVPILRLILSAIETLTPHE